MESTEIRGENDTPSREKQAKGNPLISVSLALWLFFLLGCGGMVDAEGFPDTDEEN